MLPHISSDNATSDRRSQKSFILSLERSLEKLHGSVVV